ncbi:hypothetical protein [Jannaschia sp. 2305UL9-9]|uniref:hypothetical protein n=1 Tax=Jannaschia sp. 2305UL9-9 TaxID=3121638 RepID=UPI0035282819
MTPRRTPATARSTGQIRLSTPFRITVLLDEILQFDAGDILTAVAEDFPDLAWGRADATPDPAPGDASDAVATVPCGGGIGPGVITAGEAISMDWHPLFHRNRIDPTGPDAIRMTQNRAHLEIAVNHGGTDLARRLDAARYATAIAAVFADLPITAGIAIGWCDRLMPGDDFLRAADAVRAGRIPLLHWLHLVPFRDPAAPKLRSGVSVGLASFVGVEVEIRQSPQPQAEVLRAIYAAAAQLLDGNDMFADGAEMTGPASHGAAPVTYRLRHLPEGRLGNDTDRWLLIHPESPFPDRKLLGRAKAGRPRPKDGAGSDGRNGGWLASRVARMRRGPTDGA